VRRICDRVKRFQEAVLARDVTVPLAGGGSLRQRYVPPDICVDPTLAPPVPMTGNRPGVIVSDKYNAI
jgi:hypothetical protein